MLKKMFVFTLVLMIFVVGVSAQEGDTARARLVNLIWDAPPLQAYGNGVALGGLADPGAVTDYLAIPADTYEIAFAPEGEAASASVVEIFSTQAESGHDYTALLMGSTEEGSAQVYMIDETAAFDGIDMETEVPLLFIHNLKGAPSLSLWVNGEAILENIAYGTFATANFPVGAVDAVRVAAADDPDHVLLAPPFFVDVEFAADVAWLFQAAGTYPGEPGQDMFLFTFPTFKGELTLTAGGDVQAGTSAEGGLTIGERVQYDLRLDNDMTVDMEVNAPDASPLDSYIRIYDANGELVAENDEIDFEDESLDAGLFGFELAAGDYQIEVGSFGDSSSGRYVLSVITVEATASP